LFVKNLSLLLLLSSTLWSDFLTITDRQGHIIHHTSLKHQENAYLNQSATEYSIQAIYDALQKEKQRATRAKEARVHLQYIAKKRAKATQKGTSYHLTTKERYQLLEDAKYFKGGRYVWGGTTPKGFDCSGYVQYLYKQHHIQLPRTALLQSKVGKTIQKEALKKGDLLFFLTDKKRHIPITHVGIYLGDGTFIHAASKKKGIIISPINQGYYAKKFVLAKRILPQGEETHAH
jgi:cell wall-associated NlpC family hydrolase